MEKIKNILTKTFRIKADELNKSTTIESIDTWDSLTHMELIANLEQELQIEFTGDEIVKMTSLKAIEQIVSEKQ